MNILFFTQDIGPARNLVKIAAEAVNRGHKVKSFLFFGPSILGQVVDCSSDCDVVVFSPGTLNPEMDKELIQRLKQNKKIIAFFSDTYGVFLKPQILSVASLCDFTFVPDVLEQKRARCVGFKNVIVSGVPLWEDFCKSSRYTNDDMRMELGIKKDERIVVFCGVKRGNITKRALDELVLALTHCDAPWLLLPRFHPGDEYFKDGYYDSLLSAISVRSVLSHVLFPNTSDVLPAADLVISLVSTLGIESVYRRKRVIDYIPDYFRERLKELGWNGTWNPSEFGATQKVESKEDLAFAITRLFTDEGLKQLQANQEKFYPLLIEGNAARFILDTLNTKY